MPDDLLAAVAEAARVEFYKTLLRIDNGVRMAVNGGLYEFEPEPSDVMIDERHVLLRRYRLKREGGPIHPVPVLIVPPLMVKPDIYDLRPGHSFVEFMLDEGYDVWLVDFGRPDEQDREFRLEDYLLRPINTSVERMREVTGSRQVSIFGYCMGGIFATVYAALERTNAVKNVVMLGAPVDFSRLEFYHQLMKYAEGPLVSIAERYGYFPAFLSQALFQLTQPMKMITRPVSLVWNLWDDEFLEGYEAMSKWMGDILHYPEAAFKQFARDFIRDNKLIRNEVVMFDRIVDLSKVTADYLVLASPDDHFGAPAAARPVIDAIGSREKTFMLVRGGHLGAMAGSRAPSNWRLISEWLAGRSAIHELPAAEATG
ncbi:MAG: alpha/beta fold hydrolase [Acidobacteria bacterium]|nr:alpha/beta fold hydrolase [Acidobacteriota bacterium]